MTPSPSLEGGHSSTKVDDVKSPLTALQDWDGPDDPGNPRNWSLGTKIYATAIPAMYAFAVFVFSLRAACPCVDKVQNFWHLCIHSRYPSDYGALPCEPDCCNTWAVSLFGRHRYTVSCKLYIR